MANVEHKIQSCQQDLSDELGLVPESVGEISQVRHPQGE
jgi:hypothetical protein